MNPQERIEELEKQNAELAAMVKEYKTAFEDIATGYGDCEDGQYEELVRELASTILNRTIPDTSILDRYVEKAVKPLVELLKENIEQIGDEPSEPSEADLRKRMKNIIAKFTKSEGGK